MVKEYKVGMIQLNFMDIGKRACQWEKGNFSILMELFQDQVNLQKK
jgi:hypothetical protein